MTDTPPAQQHRPAADHNGGAEPPAEAAGGKRKRSTRLEKLQKDVTDLESRHTLSEAKVAQLLDLGAWINATQKKALKKEQERLSDLTTKLQTEKEKLALATDAARVKEQEDAARKKAAHQREEMNRALSDAGVLRLIEIRLSFQPRFDNSSDKSDDIWKHVCEDFHKEVQQGLLPKSDARSVEACKKRFALELGEFRLWSATANRATKLSGVHARKHVESGPPLWSLPPPLASVSGLDGGRAWYTQSPE